jgi:hypothetical protein
MLENPHLETRLLVLLRSPPRPLRGVRRNEWLPRGARFCTAGVAVDEEESFYGWIVYSPEPTEIADGIAQRSYVRFATVVPASAELDVVYRGRDLRRAYGSANAALRREVAEASLDLELLERVWRTISASLAAERFRARRRALEERAHGRAPPPR